MKNRISALNKTLLALYAVLVAVLTVLFAVALYAGAQVSAFGYVFKLADGIWSRIAVAVVAVIILFWSYRVLLVAFSRRGAIDRNSVSISNTENGDVRISLQAMDSLVKRAIGDMSGIASIKTNVLSNDDSISVEVSMALESDVHIPNTTMLLQRTVKNFIEEYSGIAVRDVTVIVTSVAEPIVVPKQLAIETLPKEHASEPEPAIEDQPQEAIIQPEPATVSEPEKETEPEHNPEPEPEKETEPEPEEETEPEPEKEIEPEPEREAEPTTSESDFLLSDSLPDMDSFLDQTENVDYNFSRPEDAKDGEAQYYSPYEKSDGEKDDGGKK